jgi:hypothetical protein
MLDAIAYTTLHLAFPVSVHTPHNHNTTHKKKMSKRRMNSIRNVRLDEEEEPHIIATPPTCHIFDASLLYDRISESFDRLFCCAYTSGQMDLEDSATIMGTNSIVMTSSWANDEPVRRATQQKRLPLHYQAPFPKRSSYPGLQMAQPVDESVVVTPEYTMRTPAIKLSSPIRFQPDLDDCECTTATTASINSVQSWNTLPTRDVSLESSSVSWHEFFEEDYKMHRRCSSDPNLAEQEHVKQIQSDHASVIPSLQLARHV